MFPLFTDDANATKADRTLASPSTGPLVVLDKLETMRHAGLSFSFDLRNGKDLDTQILEAR